jgi:hypothetical protein
MGHFDLKFFSVVWEELILGQQGGETVLAQLDR